MFSNIPKTITNESITIFFENLFKNITILFYQFEGLFYQSFLKSNDISYHYKLKTQGL